ncbi:5,6-dimethylbenzimidazole synthase [Roseococcus sp. SYP-B2431]|uniref:5,6-dimethylbenzimidazole synthase n=1 Tax=Roseococcus sp. SYP-B2431 TaxID=2496640 RepID=UPI00103E346E|nr:5,6-dimethylbenzimidazole synthase [Roseococcus sp. SYP-B2431]TCH96710.1 5,6-dimethylbenzimidazole synthase [Roseococcus sp. SYP-B2431]
MAVSFDAAFGAQLDLLLRWRRDVRQFRSDPLPEGTLEALVERACLAPSVGNSQPWRFVAVESPERRAAIRAEFEACNAAALTSQPAERAEAYAALKLAGLVEAPVHLAVFCDETTEAGHGLGRATMPETLRASAMGAVFALWLAARARGIGVGWVSILRADRLAEILAVPEGWSLVAYLCIGYPDAEDDTPELERRGWQGPDAAARVIARR